MKKYIIVTMLFFVAMVQVANAQNPMNVVWQTCIKAGTINNIGPSGIVEALDKSGYIVSGLSNSDTVANTVVASGYAEGEYRVVFVKLDSAGNYVWHKNGVKCDINLTGNYAPPGITNFKQTRDKGFIVGGCAYNHNRPATDNDLYVAKYDSSLNLQWEHFFGGTRTDSYEMVLQVVEAMDGNFLVAGYSNSNNYDMMPYNPCIFPPCGPEQSRGMIYKLDKQTGAALIMKKSYTKIKDFFELEDSTLVTMSANYYYQRYKPNLDTIGAVKNFGSLFYQDLVRCPDKPGVFLAVGSHNMKDPQHCNNGAPNTEDGMAIFLADLGVRQSFHCYGTAADFEDFRLVVTDTYYGNGGFKGYYLFGTKYTAGWWQKIDPNGNLIWSQDYANYANINAAIVDHNGDLVIVGSPEMSPDPACAASVRNRMVVVKYHERRVSTEPISAAKSGLAVRSLGGGQYVVGFGAGTAELRLTDATGNELRRFACAGTEQLIDLSSYAQGIYFLRSGAGAVKLVR